MIRAETIASLLEADRFPSSAAYIRKLAKDREELLVALQYLIDAKDKTLAELAAKIAIERANRE